LMSIVSLVIAPTLATIYGKSVTTHEMIKELSIIKTDSSNSATVTIISGKEEMKLTTDKLIEALAADKLLNKENYHLSVNKGKLTIDGVIIKDEVAAKYKSFIDELGGADLELKNTQK